MKRMYDKMRKDLSVMTVSARLMAFMMLCVIIAACNKEPDGDNLYTSTADTSISYLKKDSDLTYFVYLLEKTGYDKVLGTYGQYTCFAPSNEGIVAYCDSLYNDQVAATAGKEHNGMTENSVYGLTDSLAKDMVQYHLTNGSHTILEMGGGGATINTMLGRTISTSVDSLGYTVLNSVATIISEDNEVSNGVVHLIDEVIPKTSRLLPDVLKALTDYSIFAEAFAKTGLADSLSVYQKVDDAGQKKEYDIEGKNYDTDNSTTLYFPTECKIAFTIFAESDAVMKANGINNFNDLVNYANNAYQNCASWYDYVREKGITVSTGTDYENPFNCLNMFIRYHILYAGMAKDQMVFEKKEGSTRDKDKWNYANGGEPQDYYETMLPHTLMKIWEPKQKIENICINRYQTYNTLTDELASMGNNHTVVNPGIKIVREDIQALNGYIHPIEDMLVYDSDVPNGVLHERMRFEATTFLPEFINNGVRYLSMDECKLLSPGGAGTRVAFQNDWFDNVECYNSETLLRYNVKGDYRSYQADAFQGWGMGYDLAVKLPPVPTGEYELRLFYSPMGHGGMMQFYLGESKEVQGMVALDIPLDVRVDAEDPRIGWTAFYEEDDQGVASDEAMRTRGYMRGPYSYCGHPGNGWNTTSMNCRGDAVVVLRKILTRQTFQQSKEYWFRYKSVLNYDPELKWQLDYVELVPVDVVDNDFYAEDWY